MGRAHKHTWSLAGTDVSTSARGAWSLTATWRCGSCRAERTSTPVRIRKPAPTATAGVVTKARGRTAVHPAVDVADVAALTALGYRVNEAYELLSGINGDSIEERVAEALRRAGGGVCKP